MATLPQTCVARDDEDERLDIVVGGHPRRIGFRGHSELGVTQRYMHLSPAALDAAIRLLDGRGNMVATAANNS